MSRRPIVLAFVAIALVSGAMQYMTMPRRADPEFTIRVCQVMTRWPGVEAERIERLVTYPLEEEIRSLQEVKYLKSTTTTGLSVIEVNLTDFLPVAKIQETWERVRSKVDIVRPSLPSGVSDPLVNDDFGDTALMLLAIHERIAPGELANEQYLPKDLETIADRIRERVALIPGIARAELHGALPERIYLETSASQWASLDLGLDDLKSLLEARNIRASGGSVDTREARFGIQPSGEFNSVEEIQSIVVGRSETGAPISLEDIGVQVRRAYEEPATVLVRYGNGQGSTPSIILAAYMQDGSQVTALGPEILSVVSEMQDIDRTIPPDIAVDVVFDEATFVANKIGDFVVNLLQAIAIVMVVALFMAGFRSAVVMGAAIPFVMIISLGLSSFLGIELEQMSIASLIIALGMLVDNAVVVCDNSKRFMEKGLPRAQAVVKGVEQIMYPTLMGTLTTVFAFLPLAFLLSGARQEYILSIPVVISVTLLSSWVLAMTLTPLMAFAVIRPSKPGVPSSPMAWLGAQTSKLTSRKGKQTAGFAQRYVALIKGCLRFRPVVLSATVALLIGALLLPVGSEFFPEDNRDVFYVDVWLPEGSSISATNRAVGKVEDLLRELSHATDAQGNSVERLARMYSSIGASGPRFALGVNPKPPSSNFAQLIVRTSGASLTDGFVNDLRVAASRRVPGARILPRKLGLGPPVDSPIGIRIYARGFSEPGFGDEWTLRAQSDRLKTVFRDIDGLWDISDSWDQQGYQMDVDIREHDAMLAGVTNASVAQTLNAYYSGHYLTAFREGDAQIPVFFRLPSEEQTLIEASQGLFIEGASGKVPIDSVADVSFRRVATRIERRDGNRMVEVQANVETGILANDLLKSAQPQIDEFVNSLPPGMWIEYGGTLEKTLESQSEMILAFSVGVILIILILIIQYNSLVKPLIVLMTVPMGAIGAFFGLWLTGNALGFMPLLGLVSLAGVVVNSGILYLEFADMLIAKRRTDQQSLPAQGERSFAGLSRVAFRDCLAEAGQLRMVPILLTASTTVGGLIPLALFGGPMWEGMAYLLIFGMLIATALTLIVLPVIYAFFVEFLRINPVPDSAVAVDL